jgi:L-seryl-tRNA(Ser) seleniumtransferase
MDPDRPTTNPFRLLPSVERLAANARDAAQRRGVPAAVLTRLAQGVIEALRTRLAANEWSGPEFERFVADRGPERELEQALLREAGAGWVRVVNATGVVLNTGLGRAPVHPLAAERMAQAAASYGTLEVERWSGKRNQRDDRISDLMVRLVGGEAAIAVNNCAAAVLLALQTFAGGKGCILSRGELVEIGGSFRMPAVMERAGVRLVEVGTTNRTRLSDYESAIDAHTGLVLKVHTSNYRVVGFTEEVSVKELAALGRRRALPVLYDLGSGLVDPAGAVPLDFLDETNTVAGALADGVDAVMFSGDKLFGGPQAGFIVGRRDTIAALRKNPLYRALRLDKVAIAGIEATLEIVAQGRADELPTRRMLITSAEQLQPVAQRVAAAIGACTGCTAAVVPQRSQPGSGTAPHVFIDTYCVAATRNGWSAQRLARELRHGEPVVFARIEDDRVLLDVRTLLPGDEELLLAAFQRLS